MINHLDLRIGNYVRHGGSDFVIHDMTPAYIHSRFQNAILKRRGLLVKNEVVKISMPYESITGVPLTVEVLEKCGADSPENFHGEADDNNAGFKYYSYKLKGSVTLTSVRKIQYLHELQNLYFRQTGKELQVVL